MNGRTYSVISITTQIELYGVLQRWSFRALINAVWGVREGR